MADRYQKLVTTGPGGFVARRVGLPQPPVLARYQAGRPAVTGPVLLGAAPGGRLAETAAKVLSDAGADVARAGDGTDSGGTDSDGTASGGDGKGRTALVFDATGITTSAGLRALYDFFHPVARSLAPSGRVIVLGTPPELCDDPRAATAQQALEGFVRSTGKEFKRGSTSQLLLVAPGAEDAIASTLRFFASPRSAYVSGQVVRIGPATPPEPADWSRPLAGQVAVVTGAANGIGAAIARVLARDGAHVVCLDIPAQGEALAATANEVGGEAVQLDVTAPDAPAALADHLRTRHGGVDAVVHNAGITRDKTLARMSDAQWDSVIDVNLSGQERIDEVLLGDGVLRPRGRIVSVSSMSGIAGNNGQTNYAASKAGVIGRVRALAPRLAARPATINAVAPGFIETRMTAAMPMVVREAGRRMNSLLQGGQPVDVAETIAWLAAPASAGVTGNVVRVCGQSLLGA